jgi:hypothetical protein
VNIHSLDELEQAKPLIKQAYQAVGG